MSDTAQTMPRTFLEKWPLYTTASYASLPAFLWPATISLDCSWCHKETTWARKPVVCDHSDIVLSEYTCQLCGKIAVIFILRQQWVTRAGGNGFDLLVNKVGQFPPQGIAVPHKLAKHLGGAADFYKKALISRNQGYGVAAVAYLRRIVEEKTDELIDIVAELARGRRVEATEIDAILSAKNQQTYSEKLKVASEVIPTALRPGGSNPLGTLFGLLSDGLHDRSEEECLQIADEIRDVFEYVFENIRTQIEDEKRFVEKMSKLTSKAKS